MTKAHKGLIVYNRLTKLIIRKRIIDSKRIMLIYGCFI